MFDISSQLYFSSVDDEHFNIISPSYHDCSLTTSEVARRNNRMSTTTSLYMAQQHSNSGSSSKEDGEDDDMKKKKIENTSNSKANKGSASKQVVNKRTQRKKSSSKKQQQSKKKSNAKTKDSSISSTKEKSKSKSTIKTSDENTSLKGFQSEPVIVPTQEDDDDNVSDSTIAATDAADDTSLQKRVVQLEMILSNQMTEIQKLRREVDDLTQTTSVFANVINVLREAGLRIDEDEKVGLGLGNTNDDGVESERRQDTLSSNSRPLLTTTDDMEIFGIAPRSVTDAADAAGASILAAILAGKHRMLVDVRDAELTRDPKLFVEFIELAVLPVAAGLEGLGSNGDDTASEYIRNRVKIVFPTVKELLSYRRSMALAAPEVVSLSTLGFDPVEERDNLIVVVAPSPDDLESVSAFEKLMARTDLKDNTNSNALAQPVVVVNHHMVPCELDAFGVKFTTVYHLRLLSVQYMTGDTAPDYIAKKTVADITSGGTGDTNITTAKSDIANNTDSSDEEDEALEAAMTHAHEIGVHQGVTRAMVIRAYPK